MNKNLVEAERWMKQAERDFSMAKVASKNGFFEHACFMCQQAAEKAVKALLYSKGIRTFATHSVKDLFLAASKEFKIKDLRREAVLLDRQYVPTRYPDSFDSGSPFEYFNEEDAKTCVSYAGSVLAEVRRLLQK